MVKRRLFWGAGAVLLALGALAYYGFFLATSEALQRAESFEFRRMQVARIDDEERFRFFFATNRAADGAAGGEDEADVRQDEGGAGLGLAIARQIIDLHKATVRIESEPGAGTRVELEFRTETAD